jgi:hypothetical protein
VFVLGNPFQSAQVLEFEGKARANPIVAPFLGKLWVFPANVRLNWKMTASTNTLAYWASLSATKINCFITLAPGRRTVYRDDPESSEWRRCTGRRCQCDLAGRSFCRWRCSRRRSSLRGSRTFRRPRWTRWSAPEATKTRVDVFFGRVSAILFKIYFYFSFFK